MRQQNTTLVLDGYGIKVGVSGGHLTWECGTGEERQKGKLSKIAKLKRVVILGPSGYVSLEAVRWLYDRGASLIVLDQGEILLCDAAMKVDYSHVRRAQAVAPGTPVGLRISKWLIRLKLEAQQQNGADLADCIAQLDGAESPAEVRDVEGEAAAIYWNSFRPEVRYDRQVPEHWRGFDSRHSPLNPNNNRKTADPVNAILNYAYTLLEAEARIAALSLGLDLGMGFNHSDERNRANLVYDLMEPVRPVVDRFVRELVKEGLEVGEFFEDRYGHVTLTGDLRHRLIGEMARWADLLGRIAEELAAELDGLDVSKFQPQTIGTAKRNRPFPTPLSQSNARRAQRKVA